MRLIDADVLWQAMMSVRVFHANTSREESLLRRCEQLVDNAPTVEAKSVVHGEWIEDQVETGDPFGNGYYLIDMLRCSVCGAFFDVSETRNFCPECGADMRKKVE